MFCNNPLISIVTVCFNSEKTIRQTIESILNQHYMNIEYILIDGQSTDGTVEVIKEYDHQFKEKGIIYRWISEADAGIYDAMNKGGRLASGSWINFMNAGDLFFDESILEKIWNKLDADLVYANHAIYRDDSNSYTVVDVRNYGDRRNIPFCHQTLFISKEYFSLFPFDSRYKIAADFDQYLTCKLAGASIKHIPITVALFLDGGLSSTSRRTLINEYFNIMKKHDAMSAYIIYVIRLIKYLLIRR